MLRLQIGVRGFLAAQRLGRLVAIAGCAHRRIAARFELDPGGLAASFEGAHFILDVRRGGPKRLDLLLVECDLLVQLADLELAGVGRFTRRGRPRVSLGQLQPEPFQCRFDFGHMRRGTGFAGARVRQFRPGRFDRFAEQPVTPGELDLLPPAQLLAEAAIPPCLCRLPLERAALLLDLEDDVVYARQVLLGGLELQLRGAAPALVLRDAGRLFDQLPTVGRTGTEDLSDFALLDDRVCLDAQARIHQEILDVAEPDGLAINQVFALARSIQPAHQFDVAHDQRRLLLHGDAAGDEQIAGSVCHRLDQRRFGNVPRDARGDTAQPQPDFGRTRRLAGIAAAEDDVLHAVAAQAFRALLAEYPGQRIDDVTFAAAVGPDNRGDAGVERELGPIRKALEAGNLKALQPHDVRFPSDGSSRTLAPPAWGVPLPGSGVCRFEHV